MAIKTYRPITPTPRFKTSQVNDDMTTNSSAQAAAVLRAAHWRAPQLGRSHHPPSWRRSQKKLRLIDFKRDKSGIPGKWRRSNTIPTALRASRWFIMPMARSAISFNLSDESWREGQFRSRSRHPDRQCAAAEKHPFRHHGACHRAASGQGRADGPFGGCAGAVGGKEGDYALLKLPSGETRRVLVDCMATIGQVGNTDHENVAIGKAGRNRWKGIRPTNRGVSMNPVDHPHGGGEGKTSGGRHPVTPWGQPTRGYKTRNNKRTDSFIVSRRAK